MVDYFQLAKEDLRVWRTQRKISTTLQSYGLFTNLLEEIGELYQAARKYRESESSDSHTREEAIHQIVDALVDISIFCINNDKLDNFDIKKAYLLASKAEADTDRMVGVLLSEMRALADSDDKIYVVDRILSLAIAFMINLGYEPIECIREGIREISSRTGVFDYEKNKYIKNKGAYTLAEAIEAFESEIESEKISIKKFKDHWEINDIRYDKWYKADYTKYTMCKEKLKYPSYSSVSKSKSKTTRSK